MPKKVRTKFNPNDVAVPEKKLKMFNRLTEILKKGIVQYWSFSLEVS